MLNIALSGTYGAGKSKIVETVQDKILLDALVANKIIASYSDRGDYYVINPKRHMG